ncbi:hypothetical protein Zm00014a_019283 [Zea mays]|uniref:Uncharacterized protein n=1 Tax=Zea mays TaxID=4577 RepID=A0A3L6FB43_MAIZE|nr:hypothetical protein Zm00014a_019283 [Zea mays]
MPNDYLVLNVEKNRSFR